MKKSLLLISVLVSAVALTLMARSGGPGALLMLQVSGAPNEGTCSGCHLGGNAGGTITIEALNHNGPYVPGTTYSLKITLIDADGAVGGFQASALNASNQSIGTFIPSSGTQTVTLSGRTYLEHNTPNLFSVGPENNATSWTVGWQAPPTTSGDVTFYVAGVAADWLGTPGGDDVYSNTFSFAALPVDFSSFEATAIKGGRIQLHWQTAQEVNSDRFEVERSLDGVFFSKIGTVSAAGHSTTTVSYSFQDLTPAFNQTFFYRLREVDQNGQYMFSEIITVRVPVGEAGVTRLYPSPAILQDHISLEYAMIEPGTLSVKLLRLDGALVYTQSHTLGEGLHLLEVPTRTLLSGHYYLETLSGQTYERYKLVIAN